MPIFINMIIGLTGTYCAGKNHVASMLEKRGLPVLDVDKLGYQALESEKEKIIAKFGSDLRKTDGSLDRRLLRQKVFKDKIKLAALEAIIHPQVNNLTDKWITSQNECCVINAALLHKSTVFQRLDKIILVKAPFFIRFLRARRRDKFSWMEIFRRISSQKGFNTQYLSSNAEIYRVDNFGFPGSTGFQKSKLERRIDEFMEGISLWIKK